MPCLVLLYLVSAPILEFGLKRVRTPAGFHAYPWINAITAPARFYTNHEEIPGSELYSDYCRWVWGAGRRLLSER